jgi:hypothetical protein
MATSYKYSIYDDVICPPGVGGVGAMGSVGDHGIGAISPRKKRNIGTTGGGD